MSGDVRRSNQTAEAQQYPPGDAESAPGEESGAGAGTIGSVDTTVRWVGQQWLMRGYCGRATIAGPAPVAAAAGESRPVVTIHRPGRTVVRIGPRPATTGEEPMARAA